MKKPWKQVNMKLADDEVAILDELAAARFGGQRVAAARWAYRIAREVLVDPSSFPANDAREALGRYIEAHRGEAA